MVSRIKDCGTDDHAFYVGSLIVKALEAKREGVLIPLDVKGDFDRMWWARLKNRLENAGIGSYDLVFVFGQRNIRWIAV